MTTGAGILLKFCMQNRKVCTKPFLCVSFSKNIPTCRMVTNSTVDSHFHYMWNLQQIYKFLWYKNSEFNELSFWDRVFPDPNLSPSV